jgi:isoleucyl-tRNA synthetase
MTDNNNPQNRYPNPNQNFNLAKIEEDILEFWNKNNIFEKSINNRSNNDDFVFYDGPPFANGLPHYGHLLTGFIKDIFARYQTMKGSKVERRFGWDTHGLPVEMETEKELSSQENKKISGQIAIQEYGIAKFNNACQKSVMKYSNEWEYYVTRQGRFVDFKNSYKTMDVNYMESVIWAFKELYDKGLIYQDLRVVPYSWSCQTPLSNFETRMDNSYRQKTSKAVTVKFIIEQDNIIYQKYNLNKISLLAWTTTPWTLPSNLALAVNSKIEYSIVKISNNEAVIIASKLLDKYQKEFTDHQILSNISGQELVNTKYQPLLPYFLENDKVQKSENAFTILDAQFVTIEDGTGIVHIAPAFGEDDQILSKANNIPTICPVDEGGKFSNEIFDINNLSLKNRQVFETNDDIIKYLKINDLWLKTEQHIHNYPHCWRTDTPLIYKAVSSWYVNVSSFKDRMVELNNEINWIPNHIKDGQFGKWLEGARDWSISRNRFWGCPVPVWQSNDPLYPRIDVYGSIEQLNMDFNTKVNNLHRPDIDNLTRLNPNDPRIDPNHLDHKNCSKMIRVSDVLDCWFESGSMPYAQKHYPFENKKWFEKNFPADFITEYVAQTRGWFYTMMVLSTALFDKIPFKNVICHGTILDENAQKLSKRLKNYPDPIAIFSNIGSDAMRFYLVSQPVMKGQDLKFDRDGKNIKDTYRISIKPLINAYNFFCLYANADNISAKLIKKTAKYNNILDRYILGKLKLSVNIIDNSLNNYDTITACNEFDNFFEIMNNWYIRRNRQRFWQKEITRDKQDAYDILYSCLSYMCISIAPILPYSSEYIWHGLNNIVFNKSTI